MGRQIRGIALDMEGTIIDVEYAHHRGFILAAADFGFAFTFEEMVKRFPATIGGGDDAVAREFAAATGVGELDFLNRKRAHYNELLKELTIELRPGALQVINWLIENGYKVAVGSLTVTVQAELLLEKTGLRQLFGQNIILREGVIHVKPNPEVYLKTANLMGIKPQEQLVFDDSATGIRAAKLAGSISVGMPVYNMPLVIKRLIDEGAIRVFMDWREMNIEALMLNLNQDLNNQGSRLKIP